ncbi:hypothetical protein BVI434_410051 [Burkholderia vietnamiensis]|nr:hypothetical protein BVI434_410051 [Burkholderia vietnamiensis]
MALSRATLLCHMKRQMHSRQAIA